MRIKQSFCYPMFREGIDLDELLGSAASIGYAAVEIWHRDESFEEFAAAVRKNRLVICSMCGHQSLADGLNRRENHDRIESELRQSIDVAVKHGIPGLICFSGNRNDGQQDRDAIEVTAAGLRRVAPYAEQHRVNLNLELLNSKINHPGYQCDHTAWGAAVIDQVNSPRVKLLYDIYHMQIMEGDVIRTIRQNIDRIGHFHTAGNPDRRDLDDVQELNYRGICRAIAEAEYSLFVGHEFRPRAEPVAALREAFSVCNQG